MLKSLKLTRGKKMFYHFDQNNSGGLFDFDEADGITHHVIEACVHYLNGKKEWF
jgi:hypothetical protein